MTRTNSVVASLLILAFLVNPLFAQTGADKEAVKTIVDFAKKRDKVAKSEEERWHDRMGDAKSWAEGERRKA